VCAYRAILISQRSYQPSSRTTHWPWCTSPFWPIENFVTKNICFVFINACTVCTCICFLTDTSSANVWITIHDSPLALSRRWNDLMAAIFKVWHHIKNLTQSVYAHLLEEQSCQISSRSDLKRRSLGCVCFEEVRPNDNNQMSSNIISVWSKNQSKIISIYTSRYATGSLSANRMRHWCFRVFMRRPYASTYPYPSRLTFANVTTTELSITQISITLPNCALSQYTVTVLHSLPLKTGDLHLSIMHSSRPTCRPNAMKMCGLRTLKWVAKWNKQIVRTEEYLPALLSLFLPLFMAPHVHAALTRTQ